jgi:hypothetical protein
MGLALLSLAGLFISIYLYLFKIGKIGRWPAARATVSSAAIAAEPVPRG